MASDDPLRSARLPSREQVIELLDGEFSRAGYEVEDVVLGGGRPPRLTVIADAEDGVDLDAIATLSKVASAALDAAEQAAGDYGAYVLEVTSRGVDRPLTTEKHFRRSRGRKVEVALADGSSLTGRIGQTAEGVVHLVVAVGKDFEVRPVEVAGIAKALVQVEFSPPNRRELELSEQSGKGGDE
ncbi:ribosome maturation factor RimP [Mycolicibacterium frederiksbergense]|uniref:Ribosome maturation factor RimP n=1 Tax=Mycolicibacterium frederiksbergense TaxID=117567 RepID=A0A6H0RXL0_9MYCO|nr:ribosome maturation factor RimP [Mycolicibacterium frederiksbergense]QIV80012.1 ribosome maturation factor RimP [Mycolicibacterium frederiksbergense]